MKTIVITGPSGSGKTFLANKLYNDLKKSIIVKTDSYYRDNLLIKIISLYYSEIYDRFISIKDKALSKTIHSIYNNENDITFHNYDFNSKKSSQLRRNNQNNTKFLIIEGIFSHRIDLNYKNTINVICSQKKEICLERRIKRDESERGRNKKEVNKKFNKSWYLFFKHISSFINKNQIYEINPDKKKSYRKLINKIKN